MQILVFGDSIVYGAWDKDGGWVQRLRRYLERKIDLVNLSASDVDYLVFNLGIGGNTSDDVLKRFDSETKPRLMQDEEATLIILEIGGNDASVDVATGKNRTPLNKFEQNVREIINLARAYTQNILVMGPVPCNDSITAEKLKFSPSLALRNSDQIKYNDAIKKVCKEQKVDFISLFDKFSKLDYEKLLLDGAHPNSKGHRKIFSIVKSYLMKKELLKN